MLSTTQGAAVPSVVFKSFVLHAHLGSALRSAVAISISWPRGNHCTPRLHIWMGVSTFAGLRPLLAYPPYFSRPSPSDPFSLARPCASDTALDQTCYDGGWDWSRRRIRVSRMPAYYSPCHASMLPDLLMQSFSLVMFVLSVASVHSIGRQAFDQAAQTCRHST